VVGSPLDGDEGSLQRVDNAAPGRDYLGEHS